MSQRSSGAKFDWGALEAEHFWRIGQRRRGLGYQPDEWRGHLSAKFRRAQRYSLGGAGSSGIAGPTEQQDPIIASQVFQLLNMPTSQFTLIPSSGGGN